MTKHNRFGLMLLFIVSILFLITHVKEGYIVEVPTLEKSYNITLRFDYTNYDIALEQIKKYEGLRLESYKLPGDDHYYIGYGHQYPTDPSNIDLEKAERLLRADFDQRLLYVSRTYFVTGNKALALAMIYYNVRPSSIRSSYMHEAIMTQKHLLTNTWDTIGISQSWLSFDMNHKKMHERREFELKLFFN